MTENEIQELRELLEEYPDHLFLATLGKIMLIKEDAP
jgi:hypothetical protein